MVFKSTFCVLLLTYAVLALVNPKKIYVDRFLLHMNYLEWAAFQPFPSMYSSENVLKNNITGKTIGICHHPMKAVVQQDSLPYKDYTLYVKYRNYEGTRNFVIRNDSLFLKEGTSLKFQLH